jgi:hypothetical protein
MVAGVRIYSRVREVYNLDPTNPISSRQSKFMNYNWCIVHGYDRLLLVPHSISDFELNTRDPQLGAQPYLPVAKTSDSFCSALL